jgi:hypothetical protein
MTIETIIIVYFSICAIVLLSTVLLMINDDIPDEIDNFYDWLFYGIFWIFIVIKYLIKFIFKLFKT